jgi:hypothetical protein
MDPLSLVEVRVCAVETWPSFIIRHMFMDEPNGLTVKNLAGFLYEKEVPLETAIKCVNACNGVNGGYLSREMHGWYYVWQLNSGSRHMAEYYNTLINCNACINGWEHDQLEEVPGSVIYGFGVERAGCPQVIQCAIANVPEEGGNKKIGKGILFAS